MKRWLWVALWLLASSSFGEPGTAKPKILSVCNLAGQCPILAQGCAAIRKKLRDCGFELLTVDSLELPAIQQKLGQLGPDDPVLVSSHGTVYEKDKKFYFCRALGDTMREDPSGLMASIGNSGAGRPVFVDACKAGALECGTCSNVALSCSATQLSIPMDNFSGMTEFENAYSNLLCRSITKDRAQCDLAKRQDKNGDGYLTNDEFSSAMGDLLSVSYVYKVERFALIQEGKWVAPWTGAELPGSTKIPTPAGVAAKVNEWRDACQRDGGKPGEKFESSSCFVEATLPNGKACGMELKERPVRGSFHDRSLCTDLYRQKTGSPFGSRNCHCGNNGELRGNNCRIVPQTAWELECSRAIKETGVVECPTYYQHPKVDRMRIKIRCGT